MTPEQELTLKLMEQFRSDMQEVDPNCVKADGKVHPAFNRDPLTFKFMQSTFLFKVWMSGRMSEAATHPNIDMAALRSVLQALTGAPHEIRELQVTRSLPGNPIDTLIDQFNAWTPAS